MHIAFRVDASRDIGTGHVMRCLTLAEALRQQGAVCRFVCREHPGNLLGLINQSGFETHVLPFSRDNDPSLNDLGGNYSSHMHWLGSDPVTDAQQTRAMLEGIRLDWLIVDHYALDAHWERLVKPVAVRLMVIDDLADRMHDCDLLLDQNWFADKTESRYNGLVPFACHKLLGPQHALLKPEYMQLRALMPSRDGIVRRVLVFLGGSDPTNQTAKAMKALAKPAFKCLAVDVVIGVNHPEPKKVAQMVAERPGSTLYQGLPSLAGLMARADLMIGAGGATGWERMCLGLPSIVISIASNQTETNLALMRAGHINFIGEMDALTSTEIAAALHTCLSNPEAMRAQSILMQNLVSGRGTAQLAQLLFT